MANDKGVNWMESMLAFCKYVFLVNFVCKYFMLCFDFRKETEELKKQLKTCRREKQSVDALYSESEKEMAK